MPMSGNVGPTSVARGSPVWGCDGARQADARQRLADVSGERESRPRLRCGRLLSAMARPTPAARGELRPGPRCRELE